MNRLNEIEARANAATEGPWEACPGYQPDFDAWMSATVDTADGEYLVVEAERDKDAEFIAHARTDVPDMAAALRAVLELHKREESPSGDYCDECFPNEWHWPCSTVATIRQRIGDDL